MTLHKLKFLMFAVIPFAIFLALLEIGFRVYYSGHDEAIRKGFRMLSSPVYASIAAPLQRGRHKTDEFEVELRSNSHGFRDKESKQLDAAFLGDSYVWGTGVEERQRFSNLFATASGIRVGNFGLCTAGTINELAIYLDFVRAQAPRYVYLVFYPNDVQNNAWLIDDRWAGKLLEPATPMGMIESRRLLPVNWPDEANLAVKSITDSALRYFIKSRLAIIKAEYTSKKITTMPGHDGQPIAIEKDMMLANSNWSPALKTYTPAIADAWDLTRTSLLALNAQIAKDGAKLILVYLPYQERIDADDWRFRKKAFHLTVPDAEMDFDKPRQIVESLARKNGIIFLDLTPALLSAVQNHPGHALYYKTDGHLTAFGNRVVAESLAAFAKEYLR